MLRYATFLSLSKSKFNVQLVTLDDAILDLEQSKLGYQL